MQPHRWAMLGQTLVIPTSWLAVDFTEENSSIKENIENRNMNDEYVSVSNMVYDVWTLQEHTSMVSVGSEMGL